MSRYLAQGVVVAAVCLGCAKATSEPVDAQAVERVVREFARALQDYQRDSTLARCEPGARWIEVNYPIPAASIVSTIVGMQALGIRIQFELSDFVVEGEGDVAWATWSLRGTFSSASEPGKAAFRGFLPTGEHGTIDSSAAEWRFAALCRERGPAAIRQHVAHSIGAYEATCSFKTCLFNLPMWRIQDQLRKRRPELKTMHRPAGASDRTNTVERMPGPESERLATIWEEEWKRDLFKRALDRVRARVQEKQFQIFDLNAVPGWPAREVARSLGVSAARVYLSKHRVGRLLAAELQDLRRQAEETR